MSLEKTWYSHAFGITTLSILPKKKKKIKGKGWGGGGKKVHLTLKFQMPEIKRKDWVIP